MMSHRRDLGRLTIRGGRTSRAPASLHRLLDLSALLSTVAPPTSRGPRDRAPADCRGRRCSSRCGRRRTARRSSAVVAGARHAARDSRPVAPERVRSGPCRPRDQARDTRRWCSRGSRARIPPGKRRRSRHRPPLLRARQEQSADRGPQRRALRPAGPRRRIDRLSLLGPRARGRLKESAHTETLNALLMRRHSMPGSTGSAESSSRGSTVQALVMSPDRP